MALPLGIVSSSSILEIAAEVLIVNGGKARTNLGNYSWSKNCNYTINQAQRYAGGGGGEYATRTATIIAGQSISVVVGAMNGGISSFSGFNPDSAGAVSKSGTISNGYTISLGNYNSGCGDRSFTGASGGGSASVQAGSGNTNGSPALVLSSFNNISISGGGGGLLSNGPNGNASGSDGGGTYGAGEGNSSSAKPGVVVIKYSASLPLPISGSFSQTSSGGFRFITCTSSTTLVW
jgi:hypothetical protein